MGVATPEQPDYPTGSGTQYPTDIDAAIAVLAAVGFQFAAHEESTPAMTVRVEAGVLYDGSAKTEVAAQSTGTITAPSSDPRNDIVWLDRTIGAIGVATGAEAATPSDPALPANKVPVARVRLQTSTMTITNDLVDDLRPLAMHLGVGSAAFLTAGTATGNLPQLVDVGGSPGLPAVDGSLLTGISTGAASDIRGLALRVAELEGDRLNMIDGIADPYGDEADVDAGGLVGFVHDAGGFYHNPSTTTEGSWGGTAASSRSLESTNGKHFAVKWTPAQSGNITSVKVNMAGVGYTAKLYTDNSGSPGTQVGSGSDEVSAGTTGEKAFTFATPPGVTGSTSYWVVGERTSGADGTQVNLSTVQDMAGIGSGRNNTTTSITDNGIGVSEEWKMEITVDTGATNGTLPSNSFTADARPDTARIQVQVEPVDTITINTDFLSDASRDGGTTWTTATLVKVGELADGTHIYEDDDIDISGQPAGTSIEYRHRTANNKEVKVHSTAYQWA